MLVDNELRKTPRSRICQQGAVIQKTGKTLPKKRLVDKHKLMKIITKSHPA
jgi:hypothetical protein